MVKASIIILTKNAGENFRRLLDKIYSQKNGYDFEVIIIDSGSTDKTLGVASEFPTRIIQIEPHEFHHSKTRNLGAREAHGDYLIFVTQDACPLSDMWLETLINNFKDPDVAGVYGRQIAWERARPSEKFFYSYFYPEGRIILSRENVVDNLEEFYLNNVFISDVNSALSKKAWETINFSDDIAMAEDKYWAIETLKAGYKVVYEPKASVYHSHDYTLKTALKRRFSDGMALKQIAGAKDQRKSNAFFSKGFTYVYKELQYLTENRYFIEIPYAILYDVVKFIGISLGKNKYAPLMLRK